MLNKLLRAIAITALLTFLAKDGLLPTAKLPQTADDQPFQQANLNRRLP
jgi:hypothetical protein